MFCSHFLFIFFKFKDLTVWYCYQARRQKSAMWGCYGQSRTFWRNRPDARLFTWEFWHHGHPDIRVRARVTVRESVRVTVRASGCPWPQEYRSEFSRVRSVASGCRGPITGVWGWSPQLPGAIGGLWQIPICQSLKIWGQSPSQRRHGAWGKSPQCSKFFFAKIT